MRRSTKNALTISGEAGMSLMEVMVSLVMMGVVLVGLGQALTLGIRMNTESKLRVSNLNLCKQVTEKIKSQIQYSQAVFDSAETGSTFNKTFDADADGNRITPGQYAPSPNFAVTISVSNWSNWTDNAGNPLSAVDSNGVSHALVKVLNVTVLAQTSALSGMTTSTATASSRETTLRVEMVRPAS
jgi:Tfp pilus assembly protein PilV